MKIGEDRTGSAQTAASALPDAASQQHIELSWRVKESRAAPHDSAPLHACAAQSCAAP